MMKCSNCGLGFAHPFVAGDAEFYNLAYPHSDYPQDKWEFSQTINALSHLVTPDSRGIEIGSGFGYFLRKISPRFFPAERLTAIEYNDLAGKKLAEGGFQVVNRDIRSDAFSDLGYELDFVFMFQVLEHMDEIASLCDRLAKLTSKGAHIFVAVPNAHRIAFNERNKSLLDMPPNHVSLWTKQSLEHFGNRMGCVVLDFQVEPMDWLQLIKQDLQYAFMRRAQERGSLANRLRSKPRGSFRRFAEGAAALSAIPLRIPYWVPALRAGEKLGGSIWAHFQKR